MTGMWVSRDCSNRRATDCGAPSVREIQIERYVLRARGQFGTPEGYVVLIVGDDAFELGCLADRGEVEVQVAVIAPEWAAPVG